VLAAVVIVATVVFVSLQGDRPPALDIAAFEAAREQWQQASYADYTVVVRKDIDSQATERIKTVVEKNTVKSLAINNRQLPIVDSYTIDGLFEIIERELEMLEESQKRPGQPAKTHLSARFDPDTGIPTIFNRLATGGRSYFLTVDSLEVPGRGVILP